jgi:hypothetical protein
LALQGWTTAALLPGNLLLGVARGCSMVYQCQYEISTIAAENCALEQA